MMLTAVEERKLAAYKMIPAADRAKLLRPEQIMEFAELVKKQKTPRTQEQVQADGRVVNEQMQKDIVEGRRQVMRQEQPVLSTLAPHTLDQWAETGADNIAPRAGAKDALSLAGRYLATGFDTDLSRMGQTSEEQEGFVRKVISHPMTGAAVAAAPFAGLAAAGIPAVTGTSGLSAAALGGIVGGGAEGALMAGTSGLLYPETAKEDIPRNLAMGPLLGAATAPIAHGLMYPMAKLLKGSPNRASSLLNRVRGQDQVSTPSVARYPNTLLDRYAPMSVADELMEKTVGFSPQGTAQRALRVSDEALDQSATNVLRQAENLPRDFRGDALAGQYPATKGAADLTQAVAGDIQEVVTRNLATARSKGRLSRDEAMGVQKAIDDALDELSAVNPPTSDYNSVLKVVARLAKKFPDSAEELMARLDSRIQDAQLGRPQGTTTWGSKPISQGELDALLGEFPGPTRASGTGMYPAGYLDIPRISAAQQQVQSLTDRYLPVESGWASMLPLPKSREAMYQMGVAAREFGYTPHGGLARRSLAEMYAPGED